MGLGSRWVFLFMDKFLYKKKRREKRFGELKGDPVFPGLVSHFTGHLNTDSCTPRSDKRELGKDENLPVPARQDIRALLRTHVPGGGDFAASKPSPTFCLFDL